MERYCRPGIFHVNRIPVEMSAYYEPLNLVDSRFPGSGSPPGAEGSSLLSDYLSVCLLASMSHERIRLIIIVCCDRVRARRTQFQAFRAQLCANRCLPISLRPPSLFDAVFIFRDIAPRRHCSQSVENIFFFPLSLLSSPRFFDETL